MRARIVRLGSAGIALASAVLAGCGNSGSVQSTVDAGSGTNPVLDAGGPAGSAQLSLSAAKVDFGASDCGGTAAAPQTLTLTNAGGAPLVWSASLDSLLFFTLTGATSGTIAPGQTATVTITPGAMPATASAGATTNAAIALSTNDPAAATTFIPITATASGATFTLVPNVANFGTFSVGTQAPDIALTLLNVGNAAAQVAFGAPSDAQFAITDTGGASTAVSVAPGTAVPGLAARFKPTSTALASTSSAITVTGAVCGGAASVASIAMSGQGTTGAASVSPGTLDFGSVNCGATAGLATTSLFNSGNAPLTWTAVLGNGAGSAYTVTPASGTLFAGAQTQIFVTPKAIPTTSAVTPNLYGDTLSISTDVPGDSPHPVTLTETAQGAILAITTTPLGYGTLPAFGTFSSQNLVITNSGNAAATLQLTAGTTSFSVTGGTAAANGGELTAPVHFTPTALGSISDAITIATNAVLCQPIPGAVAVSGSGQGVATAIELGGPGKHRTGVLDTESGCAILTGGHVACWGDNSFGQIGNGTVGGTLAPTVVPGLTGVTAISGGGDINCAVSGGLVSCWGNNRARNGRLVQKLGGGGLQSNVPQAVPGVTNATAVSVGHNIVCALQSGGTVMCWGVNNEGNLGIGTTSGTSGPIQVSGITTATGIAAGGGGACALLADQSVSCWGNDGRGQLQGRGSSTVPVAMTGITNATAIEAFGGGARSGARCALLADNTVSCWGAQSHGWTGVIVAKQQQQNNPMPVGSIATASQVSVGYGFGCATLQDGSVSCWGRNDFGQVGNATTTDTGTPTSVIGLANAVQVSASSTGACALLATGSISCWGNNGIATSSAPTTLTSF